ncbi:hypothetical protein [Photobacterium sp. 53610]|uniref:hypothetical protein n=1 Tax=Photobacterium sp. 53610 TaxID=3102789 RepID=UPI002EDBB4A1
MNKYNALVKTIDDAVEEEVTLSLNGFEITCFIGICPYQLQEGKEYPVSFELMIFDDYLVEESHEIRSSLERIDNSFSYWITGKLEGGTICSLISFEDEVLLSDFFYLDGEFIRLKANRIDVEFLTE